MKIYKYKKVFGSKMISGHRRQLGVPPPPVDDAFALPTTREVQKRQIEQVMSLVGTNHPPPEFQLNAPHCCWVDLNFVLREIAIYLIFHPLCY